MIRFRGAVRLCAVAVATSLLAGNANATCSSVGSCDKSDFKTAAASTGCGLLFITSRNENCKTAGLSLHSNDSCGPIGHNPGACSNTANNKAILARWKKCLADRISQQEAFASGLNDVEAAKKVDWGQHKKAIKEYLETIKNEIEEGQPNHAIQIQGVEVSIKRCEQFVN